MDINYFINVLQQNTETIKQLNERIKLLEDENKQQKELNEYLKMEIESTNNKIKDINYELKCSDECIEFIILYASKFKIGHKGIPFDNGFSNIFQFSEHNLNTYIYSKIGNFKHVTRLIMPIFCYPSIAESKLHSEHITCLTIYPKHYYIYENGKNNYYALKWTLDGIENIPNLTKLIIENCFGLHNVCQTLSAINHKLEYIRLTYCKLMLENNECDLLKDYCKTNNIELCLSNNELEHLNAKYLEYDDELWNKK